MYKFVRNCDFQTDEDWLKKRYKLRTEKFGEHVAFYLFEYDTTFTSLSEKELINLLTQIVSYTFNTD